MSESTQFSDEEKTHINNIVERHMKQLRAHRAKLYKKGSGDWHIAEGVLKEAKKALREAAERQVLSYREKQSKVK